MGIALTHPAQGSTSWFGAMDNNLNTLEEEFDARLDSDTSLVTVSGTTSETALMANATVPANSLQVGSVLAPWGIGTVTIPAWSTPSVTWRLRWGGISGNVLATWVWNFAFGFSAYTIGWVADHRLLANSIGASGVLEIDGWMSTGSAFSTGLITATVGSIDTTADKTLLLTAQPSATGVSVVQRQMVLNRG